MGTGAGPTILMHAESPTAEGFHQGHRLEVESALARTLSRGLGECAPVRIGGPENVAGGDVVVTTDDASSPDDVSGLTEMGEQVVVLAAPPDARAEAGYRRAGARAYLPMAAPAGPLIAAVPVS
jgi:hypothetical protein